MAWFDDHAGDGRLQKWRLYYLGLAVPLYWTECDIDIEWNGFRWTAKPITAGQINNQPDGQVAQYNVADADGAFFTVLGQQNGGELALAAIYEAGFALGNWTAEPDDVIEVFSGRVDRCSISTVSGDVVTVVLMPPVSQTSAMLPTRLISRLPR